MISVFFLTYNFVWAGQMAKRWFGMTEAVLVEVANCLSVEQRTVRKIYLGISKKVANKKI